MRLYELAQACYCYGVVAAKYDEAYEKFLVATHRKFDLADEHMDALFDWLRSWGNHNPKAGDKEMRAALRDWAMENRLPSRGRGLLDLCDEEISSAEDLHKCLDSLPGIGSTIASKVLFALRPKVFPPLDKVIRECSEPGSYGAYMREVRDDLREVERDARPRHICLRELPVRLGRPRYSTGVKLIDEYKWFTAKYPKWRPLSGEQLACLQLWLRPHQE